MFNPVTTYRVQLHKNFRLEDLARIIGYLHTLGIHTVYASPVFSSVAGSTHGYDGIDPWQVNTEIGTYEELEKISKELKSLNMGWLQDIVPNHMAYHTCNEWLMDVLEKGERSLYASFFDTCYTGSLFRDKLMAPFLGAPAEAAAANGEIQIAYEQQRLVLRYYDQFFPLKPETYATLLLAEGSPLQSLINELPATDDKQQYAADWKNFCRQLSDRTTGEPVRKYMTAALERINSDPEQLLSILTDQHYRLCYWRETDEHITYRRFFTINGLVCLNIQYEAVFSAYHRFVAQLVKSGIFSGLRIDHIDGLYDPQIYLERLRALAGKDTYITVEKILQPDEYLPASWPVQGNTGYDFLAIVNNLFTWQQGKKIFSDYYRKITGRKEEISELLTEKKQYILQQHMRGELDNLYHLFTRITGDKLAETAIPADSLKDVIAGILLNCPVYRYYSNSLPLPVKEAAALESILGKVEDHQKGLAAAVAFFRQVLLHPDGDAAYLAQLSDWYCRLMQFTGPLMAKGMEDTLMYTYNRFIGHNDVGDSPAMFGIAAEDVHRWMEDRQQHRPLSANATATHDTKRGEDVRARLNVLTEIGEEWVAKVSEWRHMNKEFRPAGMPDANDEYFLYQTIVGAWPMPGGDVEAFTARLKEYIPKALREAKTHTQWASPNEIYEQAVIQFAEDILQQDSSFRNSLEAWLPRIADFGIVNSLSQLLLKCTCPGVPDIYQGTELWDLSLVDPDNRRPVDYTLRNGLFDKNTGMADLWKNRYSGEIKFWLTQKILQERNANPDVFAKGSYIPLTVKGKYKDHILAFARRYEHTWYLVAVPLYPAQRCNAQDCDLMDADWKDTHIVLPDHAPGGWQHLFTKEKGSTGKSLAVADILKGFPVALLKLDTVTDRSAGLLLHITSLPSHFGIGDMGPAARSFADFLCNSCQKYWQLLPLNPVVPESDYSPYSSVSAMAGNELLISPELLAEEGLLDNAILHEHKLRFKDRLDFDEAIAVKTKLLDIAYDHYCKGSFPLMQEQFAIFCRQEQHWLDDFALFVVLRNTYHQKPWAEWPEEYRDRDKAALESFASENEPELDRIKWMQFQFVHQWKQLRAYCNGLGIKLFGDLPFYVSHNSADVWAHRDIFCLNKQGEINGIAGVPPDYFSEDGQLWGMPTYNWKVLEKQQYDWWLQRLQRNMDLYDLLRLDHFRAFAEYWEVPAGETTARNGRWVDGPGMAFFRFMRERLGKAPFVAEDLGDHMEAVYRLRDEAKLPGMKVLQFAFGSHMAQSVDIPHNYTPDCIVYTGTHDNNTTVGWYEDETGRADHKRLEKYAGTRVNAGNIHLVLMRIAYASIAQTVIIPVQDALGMGKEYRMNVPGTSGGNWRWRLLPDELDDKLKNRLCHWAKMYNRL